MMLSRRSSRTATEAWSPSHYTACRISARQRCCTSNYCTVQYDARVCTVCGIELHVPHIVTSSRTIHITNYTIPCCNSNAILYSYRSHLSAFPCLVQFSPVQSSSLIHNGTRINPSPSLPPPLRTPSPTTTHYDQSSNPLTTECLLQKQLGQLVGASMLIASTAIFLYYTIWTLVMVHIHPFIYPSIHSTPLLRSQTINPND